MNDMAPPRRDALARLARLARKELLEIFRDRRTILTLVLMPLLLYPVLSIAFQQFFLASRLDPSRGLVYRLGFATEIEAAVLSEFMKFGNDLLRAVEDSKEETIKSTSSTGPRLEA